MSIEARNKVDSEESFEQKIAGHVYDGIEEYDNALPAWWINGFYLTIVFAVLYFVYYSLGSGWSIRQEYDHDLQSNETLRRSQKAAFKAPTDAELEAMLKDPQRTMAGKAVYEARCASCHGNQAQGGIGPNLTDDYWIHGGSPSAVYTSISAGIVEKGMPPWNAVLKPEELYSVLAFVKSVRGTNPANPKAPQGELLKQ